MLTHELVRHARLLQVMVPASVPRLWHVELCVALYFSLRSYLTTWEG
jgi:hypothetical protein